MKLPKYKREYICLDCGLIWIDETDCFTSKICPGCHSHRVSPCDTAIFAYSYISIKEELAKRGKNIHYAKNHPLYKDV